MYNASHYHVNNTDVCDAIVDGLGPWTVAGAVNGINTGGLSRKYVFLGLADDTDYTVRVRAGAEPAASDIVVATIEPESSGGGGGVELTGPNLVTITVVDDASSDPIQSAKVRIYQGLYTQTKYTNASGVATFTVESATWELLASEPLHVGESDSIVVPSELTKEIRLVAAVLDEADDPAECAVTFEIRDQGNTLLAGAKVSPSLGTSPAGVPGATLINTQRKGVTDTNGRCTITLVRSSEITNGDGVYGVRVDYLGECYQFRLTVPDSGSYLATMDI